MWVQEYLSSIHRDMAAQEGIRSWNPSEREAYITGELRRRLRQTPGLFDIKYTNGVVAVFYDTETDLYDPEIRHAVCPEAMNVVGRQTYFVHSVANGRAR